MGDSLTSGHGIGGGRAFPALLQARLNELGYDYRVVNAAVSGDTTAGAARRIKAALQGDVRVLIVALGANDGLRGVPVPQLRANLTTIVEEAQSRGITVLLCAMEALPIYGWDYTVAFHRAYEEIAANYDVPLVPFFLMNVIGRSELMLPDRIHPNADGARAIADTVWPHLERLLARVAVHD